MNNGIKSTFIFFLGAAAGAVVTWALLKNKYEQIAQEEIDSVKEVFAERLAAAESEGEPEAEKPTDKEVEKQEIKGNIKVYSEIIKGEGYNTEEQEDEDVCKPTVISPEEFGEMDGYDTVSLTYYADGVLTDDYDNVIEDVDSVVGRESLTHFGEYEDDSVFVRNVTEQTDYEILLDTRKYSDVMNNDPHLTED